MVCFLGKSFFVSNGAWKKASVHFFQFSQITRKAEESSFENVQYIGTKNVIDSWLSEKLGKKEMLYREMTSTSPFFRAAELPLSRPNGQSRLRQFEAVGLSLHVPWPASRSAHFSLGQHYVTQSQAWCIQNRLGVSQPSPSHLHNHVDSYRPCHLQVCLFWKALLALNVILISGFCTVTSKDDAVLFRFV